MEIRARYLLIGAFTLAVIAAGFGFIYWLNGGGTMRNGTAYRIDFQNTVSGLLVGSTVQFNGLRVGEVSAIDLSADDPRRVSVTAVVAADTPIRADTKVGIAFQGLMGAPAVSLTGGDAQSPPPAVGPDAMPRLIAAQGAGDALPDVARDVLRHIDEVVTTNAAPLKSAIANLSTFSEALGRNSTHVDAIVAGLERFTGGAAKTPAVFDLTAPQSFPAFEKPARGQLAIREVTAIDPLSTDRILARGKDGSASISDDAKWSDMLPLVVQSRLLQGFENANLLDVSRSTDGLSPDFQLLTELRRFELVSEPTPMAEVEFSAKLLGPDGKIVAAKIFKATRPVQGKDAAAAAEGLDATFRALAGELVAWTATQMRGAVASTAN